ncbi:hypothetical protein San01_68730 [Streptomyces angustmyceticus]|uniref:DUF4126 domain-containing protein n=1 Tax=Streptomyces angustmyceticus TaxID=285578 RepID=A0A5J4LVH0_9ACTN|nr:hypothetical protein San01_68730 [Streptomyces angustmyceticus]
MRAGRSGPARTALLPPGARTRKRAALARIVPPSIRPGQRFPRTPPCFPRIPRHVRDPRRSAAPCRRCGALPFRGPHSSFRAGAGPSAYLLISGSEYGYSNLSTPPQWGPTLSRVSVLPLVFTSGWASGINAYAVVLLFGLLGATGVTDEVPAALQRPDVLIVAGLLFLCEAVADKIPYVDSVWDSVHTVIRPVSGAVVGALLAGQNGSLPELAAGAVGGSTALLSHLVKAGARIAVNTSPEPASNIVLSLAEDLGVAGLIAFAVFHPVAAAVIAATLLLAGIALVVFLWSRIRRYLRRRRQRREEKRLATAGGALPPAV